MTLEPVPATVRRMGAEEAEAFRTLRLEALRDSPQAFCQRYDEAVARSAELWRANAARCCRPGQVMVVAEAPGGDWLAMMGAFLDSESDPGQPGLPDPPVPAGERWAMLWGVYVTPAARGSGVAARLLAEVRSWARGQSGARWLGLEVAEHNGPARAFYSREGFRATDARRPHPIDPGVDELVMVLPLGG